MGNQRLTEMVMFKDAKTNEEKFQIEQVERSGVSFMSLV